MSGIVNSEKIAGAQFAVSQNSPNPKYTRTWGCGDIVKWAIYSALNSLLCCTGSTWAADKLKRLEEFYSIDTKPLIKNVKETQGELQEKAKYGAVDTAPQSRTLGERVSIFTSNPE